MTVAVAVHRAHWPEIAPLARVAAKDKVTVSETSDPTLWFKTLDPRGGITGFAGIASVGRSKARIRAVWVAPEYREKGLGDALARACLNYAMAARFATVEVLTFDPTWPERAGFVVVGRTVHGAARMIYTVIPPPHPGA